MSFDIAPIFLDEVRAGAIIGREAVVGEGPLRGGGVGRKREGSVRGHNAESLWEGRMDMFSVFWYIFFDTYRDPTS